MSDVDSTPLLAVDSIDVSYSDLTVLRDVSLVVEEGETVALLGPNGAGKTTTLQTICGPHQPDSGEIRLHGQPIGSLDQAAVVSRGVAHVPEGREIFTQCTVRENLVLGAYTNSSGTDDQLERVFELFPRLAERTDQRAGTLSGGEQQMLAIGRGLMSDPDLLLLDEVSLGLAPVLVEDVFEAIERINSHGTTVLLVEQDIAHGVDVADRGYILASGEVALSGPAETLVDDDTLVETYLGG